MFATTLSAILPASRPGMAMNVFKKTALVTGAGSGINLCFAQQLLEKGCNVIFADLALRPEAEAVVARYPPTSKGAKAVFQKTDVTDWAQLDKMFEVAGEHFGGADIVCPGAGVYEPVGIPNIDRRDTDHLSFQPWSNFWYPPGKPPSKDLPASCRYALIDINITHPIRLTQMAISHFLSRKKPGVIPHISSVAGQSPFFPTPVYVASKHAISGFVRSLAPLESPPKAKDGGIQLPKIRVNAVAPARILTPLWTENADKMKMVSDKTGWVTPEDVARVMVELVEREDYVGGSVIEIGETVRRVESFNDPGPIAGRNHVIPVEGVENDMWVALERQFKGE